MYTSSKRAFNNFKYKILLWSFSIKHRARDDIECIWYENDRILDIRALVLWSLCKCNLSYKCDSEPIVGSNPIALEFSSRLKKDLPRILCAFCRISSNRKFIRSYCWCLILFFHISTKTGLHVEFYCFFWNMSRFFYINSVLYFMTALPCKVKFSFAVFYLVLSFVFFAI